MVATTAPKTSPIASRAATRACIRLVWMKRSMFSMTTIASSTTSPVARVMPKRVSVLIEKPRALAKAKVPISDTGMVTAGMTVLRSVCRKTKMTSTTRRTATPRVKRTSLSDSLTTRVVSKAMRNFTPGGKRPISRSSSEVTAFFTASALALGSW